MTSKAKWRYRARAMKWAYAECYALVAKLDGEAHDLAAQLAEAAANLTESREITAEVHAALEAAGASPAPSMAERIRMLAEQRDIAAINRATAERVRDQWRDEVARLRGTPVINLTGEVPRIDWNGTSDQCPAVGMDGRCTRGAGHPGTHRILHPGNDAVEWFAPAPHDEPKLTRTAAGVGIVDPGVMSGRFTDNVAAAVRDAVKAHSADLLADAIAAEPVSDDQCTVGDEVGNRCTRGVGHGDTFHKTAGGHLFADDGVRVNTEPIMRRDGEYAAPPETLADAMAVSLAEGDAANAEPERVHFDGDGCVTDAIDRPCDCDVCIGHGAKLAHFDGDGCLQLDVDNPRRVQHFDVLKALAAQAGTGPHNPYVYHRA